MLNNLKLSGLYSDIPKNLEPIVRSCFFSIAKSKSSLTSEGECWPSPSILTKKS